MPALSPSPRVRTMGRPGCAAVAVIAALTLAPVVALAQQGSDSTARHPDDRASWLYASAGLVGTQKLGGATSPGAGPFLNIAFSPYQLEHLLPAGVGFRFEFHDVMYGLADYASADPRFTDKEIASGVRTHAFGIQVMRPTRAALKPYAAAMVGQVKLTLDADDEKLARRDGVGGVFRLGTYVALWPGAQPPVLDLSAAYHVNGSRQHWREGEVTLQRASLNFVSVTAAIGISGLVGRPD